MYPFVAVVNQEMTKKALLYAVVNPAVGGVLLSGPSGTAKSTLVRSLVELLPEVEVVKGCPFSCDPADPSGLCPTCRVAAARGPLPRVRRPVRLVNLPLNATEDRVAGTLDLAPALRDGEVRFRPGLLADAHRGILYVDEINLLDDYLVDILLDAAALGINHVEREGISVSHPSRFVLVGTMNPEEGELRPQIADRIGIHVAVKPLEDNESRTQVLDRWDRYLRDQDAFRLEYAAETEALKAAVERARNLVRNVTLPEDLRRAIPKLTSRAGAVSHRADVAVMECARAAAALAGRLVVSRDDLLAAAPLALSHRLIRDPLSPGWELDARELERIAEDAMDVREGGGSKKALAGGMAAGIR